MDFNYLDTPLQFMQDLCANDRKDRAWSIKSKILEVCEYGLDQKGLEKWGDTPNLYRIKAKPAPADGIEHPGFVITLLLLATRVIVTDVKQDEVA